MTEQNLRRLVVDTFCSYNGVKQNSTKHKDLIDTYNTITPLPRGVKMTYSMPWCAATVSAISQKLGLTDTLLPECSCSKMIDAYQKIGCWEERDNYVPQIGDLVMYDWQDGSDYVSIDDTGAPDHVGMVVDVNKASKMMRIIEGNKGTSSTCGYRSLQINGRFIRGFCLPDYAKAAKTYKTSSYTKIEYCSVNLPVLTQGATGQTVETLQVMLRALGYKIDLDGSFGPETANALSQFQKGSGLVVDKSCGPLTWTALITGGELK